MEGKRRFVTATVAAALAIAGCSSSGIPFNPPQGLGPHVSSTISSGITTNAALFQATNGPDGRIWFTEFNASNLAAVTTAGTVTEYPVGGQPNGIAVGPDGNLWTGGFGGVMTKVNTGGTVLNTYPIPGAHIAAVASGPGSLLWFTDYGNGKVGTISTTGTVNEYALPAGASPSGLAVGTDGNVWIADAAGSIVKVSPSGAVLAQYTSGITAGEEPQYIASAPNGKLYFTEAAFSASKRDRVAYITTSGTIKEIGSISSQSYPIIITVGKDNNLYFTEYGTKKLGKVTVATNSVSEFSPGFAATGNSAIDAGPDGRLWVGGFSAIYALNY
jgi:virginiamycin B lyase